MTNEEQLESCIERKSAIHGVLAKAKIWKVYDSMFHYQQKALLRYAKKILSGELEFKDGQQKSPDSVFVITDDKKITVYIKGRPLPKVTIPTFITFCKNIVELTTLDTNIYHLRKK